MTKPNNTKPKKSLSAMVPVGLPNIDKLFPDKVTADRVRVILQLLFFVRMRMRRNLNFAGGVDRETGYCPISARVLKTVAGNGYRKIIDRMIELKIIQIRENIDTGHEVYMPYQWSKLYRIHPKQKLKTFNGRSYRREKVTHPDVINAVKRHYDRNYSEQLKAVKSKGKVYTDIVRYSNCLSLDIIRLEDDIKTGALKDDSGLLVQAITIEDRLSRWCHIDEFGRRLHTHLGNMPKELRPYLVLDKEPETSLIMVDLKSSQPYFLSLLFYKPELLNLIPEFEQVSAILEANRSQPDIRIFYEDCAAGDFYDKCFMMLSENKNQPKEMSEKKKKELKIKLFQHIFYSATGNYHKDEALREERQKVVSRFKLVYPTVFENLIALKRIRRKVLPFVYDLTSKGKKSGKMYATPNCMAQRIESRFILDHIATILFKMGVPVFTIHDAFILEERHSELLMQVIEQTFTKQLNVKPPKVHITRFAPGQQ